MERCCYCKRPIPLSGSRYVHHEGDHRRACAGPCEEWSPIDTAAARRLFREPGVSALCDEVDALRNDLAEMTRQRDAYRRAKQENDERFLRERDQAREAAVSLFRSARSVSDMLRQVADEERARSPWVMADPPIQADGDVR